MQVCVGFLMTADFCPELMLLCFTVDGGIMAHQNLLLLNGTKKSLCVACL